MAKCKPFGHITHIIGFIEMFCLNYFDLVTGNPTVCAVLQLLYFLFKTILHMDFTPFCNCVQICTLDHGVVLCVHTLFYFKYSPSQYDLPVQSSLLAYGGLLWRFGIQCHTRLGEGGIIMCTERQQLARHNDSETLPFFLVLSPKIKSSALTLSL